MTRSSRSLARRHPENFITRSRRGQATSCPIMLNGWDFRVWVERVRQHISTETFAKHSGLCIPIWCKFFGLSWDTQSMDDPSRVGGGEISYLPGLLGAGHSGGHCHSSRWESIDLKIQRVGVDQAQRTGFGLETGEAVSPREAFGSVWTWWLSWWIRWWWRWTWASQGQKDKEEEGRGRQRRAGCRLRSQRWQVDCLLVGGGSAGTFLLPLEMADDAWWRFGIRVRSKDRKHGDPFPLPRLTSAPGRDKMDAVHELRQRVDQSFKSLNDLASADFSPATTSLPLTSVQEWIMQDVWRRVENLGSPPSITDEEALREEAANLVEMDLSKIRILRRRLDVTPAERLLPPQTAVYLQHFDELMRSPLMDQKESEPITPYWDPSLRDDFSKRMQLYKALDASHLLTFRKRRKGRVAFFTVKKKDGQQRLIVDAREANSKHRRPPTTSLSTPSGFMDLDFSKLDTDGQGEVLQVPAGCMFAGDVGDCFYNFSVERLSSWFWFCTDDRLTVGFLRSSGFDITTIYDDLTGKHEPVSDDTWVWPAFFGMSMGWSWALFLANEIVAYQSPIGSGLGADRFLRDKMTVPSVASGPVVRVYVDNVNVVAREEHTAAETMRCVADRFGNLGIPFEITDMAGERVIESLGLEFRFGESVVLRNTSKRTWRLWRATRALLGRHRVSGEVLRVWLGHVDFFFQLARSGLSALSACYRFMACSLGRRRALWPNVRKELRTVLGLLPLVEHDLGAARSEVVHLGDSSTENFGFVSGGVFWMAELSKMWRKSLTLRPSLGIGSVVFRQSSPWGPRQLMGSSSLSNRIPWLQGNWRRENSSYSERPLLDLQPWLRPFLIPQLALAGMTLQGGIWFKLDRGRGQKSISMLKRAEYVWWGLEDGLDIANIWGSCFLVWVITSWLLWLLRRVGLLQGHSTIYVDGPVHMCWGAGLSGDWDIFELTSMWQTNHPDGLIPLALVARLDLWMLHQPWADIVLCAPWSRVWRRRMFNLCFLEMVVGFSVWRSFQDVVV